MSETISALLREALLAKTAPVVETDLTSDLPIVRLGRVITDEEIERFDDEEELELTQSAQRGRKFSK